MKIKIAITGISGFVGQNFYNKYKNKYKIIPYRWDVNNFEKLKLFVNTKKIDFFIHLAAVKRSSSKNKILFKKTNYISVKNICKLIGEKTHLIFASTCHVYQPSKNKLHEKSKLRPVNYYGLTKLLSEKFIKSNVQRFTILRIFNIYGNNQPRGFVIPDLIYKIKNNIVINIDYAKKDFVNINFVVRFLDHVIRNRIQGIINVGSGKAVLLSEIIKIIEKKYNKISKTIIKKNNFGFLASINKLKNTNFRIYKKDENFNFKN